MLVDELDAPLDVDVVAESDVELDADVEVVDALVAVVLVTVALDVAVVDWVPAEDEVVAWAVDVVVDRDGGLIEA